jgi:carboxypeptidase family protein
LDGRTGAGRCYCWRTMRLLHLTAAIALLTSLGCHPGPIVDTGSKPAGVGGTIAGIVSSQANTPIADRKVTAIETTTGTRYDATTGSNGGYTIKVPQGHYRLEVELRAGEKVVKQPNDTRINKSDLDPHRDFVIAGG